MQFNKHQFFYTVKTQRRVPEENKIYSRNIDVLNFKGMGLIAKYYNDKYFSKSPKKIVLTQNISDLKQKILQVLQSRTMQCLGLVYLGEDVEHSEHSYPLIFENQNDQPYLFICDSIAGSASIDLAAFCTEMGITMCINAYMRQADVGSCKTESLVYLKNALQQTSIRDHVHILSPEEARQHFKSHPAAFPDTEDYIASQNVHLFLESPDMLKTTQTKSAIDENQMNIQADYKAPKPIKRIKKN